MTHTEPLGAAVDLQQPAEPVRPPQEAPALSGDAGQRQVGEGEDLNDLFRVGDIAISIGKSEFHGLDL